MVAAIISRDLPPPRHTPEISRILQNSSDLDRAKQILEISPLWHTGPRSLGTDLHIEDL